ncbi:hypothetical protein pclt_cds_725 [Pandoravirus celtis]|uniref:Uncharacterized protein n=1 Tax=Pandoravirus celtis TaxID=2568002 RepID=A0A4D6EHN0_9VIRU|nr:hypothetical protein pclt_cds_725 [Pandoravirus celtis]
MANEAGRQRSGCNMPGAINPVSAASARRRRLGALCLLLQEQQGTLCKVPDKKSVVSGAGTVCRRRQLRTHVHRKHCHISLVVVGCLVHFAGPQTTKDIAVVDF